MKIESSDDPLYTTKLDAFGGHGFFEITLSMKMPGDFNGCGFDVVMTRQLNKQQAVELLGELRAWIEEEG